MNGLSFFLRLGLNSWREAVSRSHTAAQLAMALYVLESCVAWDKSIMKAVSFAISIIIHIHKSSYFKFNIQS